LVTPAGGALDDPDATDAAGIFRAEPEETYLVYTRRDEEGRRVQRVIRALRNEQLCMTCHTRPEDDAPQYDPDQLVALIDLSLPAEPATLQQAFLARAAFALGGVVAGVLAFVSFALITHRLVLGPIRHLRDMADRVAEGDLAVRSELTSEDELQHLGQRFNSMLSAISEQHERLRAVNRALDLKLSELSESNVALFEANKVKTEFLANMSHELRTPLNSIIGFADLLAEAGDDRIRRYGQNISTSAKSLMALITELLDLAKIEAGRATVRLDKVSILDTCQTLAALTKPLADKKQQDVELALDDAVPLITTDGAKVQQILFNFMSNAVKFTPANGTITLSARAIRPRSGEDVQEIAVAVADNGPGISETDQKQIFEKFYQSDQTLTKQSGGAGLGLAISKDLAGLLGGRITLDSSPGAGATFTLFLPVEPAVNGESASGNGQADDASAADDPPTDT
ncbi:MAG: sensor histidine kinase, partial [Planctomycetota bacterium]